jgi:hypothetical protein
MTARATFVLCLTQLDDERLRQSEQIKNVRERFGVRKLAFRVFEKGRALPTFPSMATSSRERSWRDDVVR